jgi:FAD:protein FMN transferase
MDNRRKNIIYSIILFAAIFIVYKYRQAGAEGHEPVRFEGQTMGTTYHVTYFDRHNRNFKKSVDSLLVLVNKSINTYDPASEVSVFNKSKRGVAINLPYLVPSLKVARKVYDASEGAFDPTVMPLVNLWGFGPGKRINADSSQIDSVKSFVGFDKVTLTRDSIIKNDYRLELDFGGIGQGYGADVITEFLRSKEIANVLVELGGEGMAVGKNLKSGKPWEIGILDPASTEENQFFKAYVSLIDEAFTTSGNYFNFHVEDGIKYSHTIDPKTGYPAKKAILSASVFAADCTTADAWATALMVLGHEEAIKIVKLHSELQVLLMYSDENGKVQTFITPGIKEKVRMAKDNP